MKHTLTLIVAASSLAFAAAPAHAITTRGMTAQAALDAADEYWNATPPCGVPVVLWAPRAELSDDGHAWGVAKWDSCTIRLANELRNHPEAMCVTVLHERGHLQRETMQHDPAGIMADPIPQDMVEHPPAACTKRIKTYPPRSANVRRHGCTVSVWRQTVRVLYQGGWIKYSIPAAGPTVTLNHAPKEPQQ